MIELKFNMIRSNCLMFAACAMLCACAAPTSYMGISLKSNSASVEVQQLAEQALAGDKQAQLELGIRFEEGDGVARSLPKAKSLYRQAASNNMRRVWVYTPPVGRAASGRLVSVDANSEQRGLAEAKLRLEAMLKSGTGQKFSLGSYLAGQNIEAGIYQFHLNKDGSPSVSTVKIDRMKKECPDPSLMSRKIACNNVYYESEMHITYSEKLHCFNYKDFMDILPAKFLAQNPDKFDIDSGNFFVPQQSSFVAANALILVYPGFESQKTCITRMILVESIK